MQRRPYGQTGEALSIVGFGAIVVMDTSPEEASRYVAEAVDRGVNYFDVAPSYGNAEERLGPALVPYRDRVFLACKTGKREGPGAREELERSLKRLQTDHVDLYQLHGLTSVAEVEQAFGPGGAMETFLAAREEGKVRFLGFSAHSVDAALLALDRFKFDSVLFPFNFVTYGKADFGPQVIEAAEKRGSARLALKAMARRPWPEGVERVFRKCWYEPISDPHLADLALRFTLSLPITAAVSPGHVELFRMAMDIADRVSNLTEAERQELDREARSLDPIFRKAA